MAYGVFIHRSDSIYDDIPSERYQFPKQYLERARQCEGSWIVYYEPQKVPNTRGYFAVARVQKIIPDPGKPGMFIALIEPGTYLDFGDPAPFRNAGMVLEQGLVNDRGAISGRAQAAVRNLSPEDFNRILEWGLGHDDGILPRTDDWGEPLDSPTPDNPLGQTDRIRIQQVTTRAVRDRNFRKAVLRAYGERCAMTGIRLLNGGGRAEAEAAHIRPVKDGGPDIVGNGIALSGTAHWMFDRGLVGLEDDLRIIVSRQYNDPETIRSMINNDEYLQVPDRVSDRPRPEFVAWHREHCFKG